MAQELALMLKMTAVPCLLVGGGRVAERKLRLLLAAGAKVEVQSPEVTPTIARLAQEGRLVWKPLPYQVGEGFGEARLVVAATDDRRLNRSIAEEAQTAGVWVNCVDDPEISTVLFPAQRACGQVVFAVSTGGRSPALAAALAEEVTARYGEASATLATFLGEVRAELSAWFPDPQARYEFLRQLAGAAVRGELPPPTEERERAWAYVRAAADKFRLSFCLGKKVKEKIQRQADCGNRRRK